MFKLGTIVTVILFPALAVTSFVPGGAPIMRALPLRAVRADIPALLQARAASSTRALRIAVRQTSCANTSDFLCADFDGCCPIGNYCGVFGGKQGCCPGGDTCADVVGPTCEFDDYFLCPDQEFCCPNGDTCFRGSADEPLCTASAGGGGGGGAVTTTIIKTVSAAPIGTPHITQTQISGSSNAGGGSGNTGPGGFPVSAGNRATLECGFMGAVTVAASFFVL